MDTQTTLAIGCVVAVIACIVLLRVTRTKSNDESCPDDPHYDGDDPISGAY